MINQPKKVYLPQSDGSNVIPELDLEDIVKDRNLRL